MKRAAVVFMCCSAGTLAITLGSALARPVFATSAKVSASTTTHHRRQVAGSKARHHRKHRRRHRGKHHAGGGDLTPIGSGITAVHSAQAGTSGPVARFSYSPTAPTTGQQVTFNGSATNCAAPCTYSYVDVTSSGTGDYPLATSENFTYTFQDAGTKYVKLTVKNRKGQTSTVQHNINVSAPASAPPASVAPANMASPTISGTAQEGDKLSASPGTWSGTAPISYSYRWSDGTSGSTDTLSAADVGQSVSVVVTAANTAGSVQATSPSMGPVIAPDPPAPVGPSDTSAPTISGTAQVGDTLTASPGSWSGDTPMSFSYLWSDGATGQTDTLPAADLGQSVSVTVTATNDGGSASATSGSAGPVTSASSPPPPPPTCTKTLTSGSIAAAINDASSGQTICLDAGTYTGGTVNGDNFSSNTTIESADGTRDVTVDGTVTIDNSSNITLQGLDIEGGGIGGAGGVAFEGTSGSNYTLNNDTIANSDFGVIIGSSSGAVSNVTISNSTLHNFDFSGSSAGTGGGQAVSCYWCSGYTHVEHDVFYAASWHYIQCGGCSDFTVDHNLFSCPCNQHSGAHLNVFQIWQGGSDDSFTNNIVIGNPNQVGTSGEICGGCVLFENGPGGGTASDGFTNYDVSNNLFVNSGGSLPIQVQTTTGGTVSNNTVADGFQYGIAIGYNGVTNVASTSLVSQYNIVANGESGAMYRYGCAGSACVADDNVTTDSSATSDGGLDTTADVDNWPEAWQTTTWANPLTTPMPTGFYQPAAIASEYGYQGQIGP